MTLDFWKSYLLKKLESRSDDRVTYQKATPKEVAPL